MDRDNQAGALMKLRVAIKVLRRHGHSATHRLSTVDRAVARVEQRAALMPLGCWAELRETVIKRLTTRGVLVPSEGIRCRY